MSANATRLSDLPIGKNYALIAVAPWFSANCTQEYFTSARLNPTKAYFTYLLGQGTAKPPVLKDASWDLKDGGSWQSENFFPTYALSSATGGNIMAQLDEYSGNISSVPNGPALEAEYNSTDYVRLWATVNTGQYLCLSPLIFADISRLWQPTSKSMGLSRHCPRYPHLRSQHHISRYAYHAEKA